MAGYADPELLIAEWLHAQVGCKVWRDPRLPGDWKFTAPITHLQRAQGGGEPALTLDDVLLDVDVYAANADHARETAHAIWTAMTFSLPLTTFDNGVFVKYCAATARPVWTFDASVYRRTAAYRVILHGLTA